MEQDFHGNCQVNVTFFLPFSPMSLTGLCSFWYGSKDLFTLHKSVEKLSLSIKTDDVTSSRRDMDPHGWLQAA